MAESFSTSSETDYFNSSIVEFVEFDDLLASVDFSIEERSSLPKSGL